MIKPIKEDLKQSGVFADCEIHIFAVQILNDPQEMINCRIDDLEVLYKKLALINKEISKHKVLKAVAEKQLHRKD